MNDFWLVIVGGFIGLLGSVIALAYQGWDANRKRKWELEDKTQSIKREVIYSRLKMLEDHIFLIYGKMENYHKFLYQNGLDGFNILDIFTSLMGSDQNPCVLAISGVINNSKVQEATEKFSKRTEDIIFEIMKIKSCKPNSKEYILQLNKVIQLMSDYDNFLVDVLKAIDGAKVALNYQVK